MCPNIKIVRDAYGNWKAVTNIMLTDTLELGIVTSKRASGNVVSSASVSKVVGNWSTHMRHQDFSKQLVCVRDTCKVVEQQHNSLDFESVMLEAKAFYKLT